MASKRIAVYAGSFDPLTNGHCEIIKQAAQLFDTLYVVVSENTTKKTWFSAQERLEFLENACQQLNNVTVAISTGLTVDFARKVSAIALIRGLRSGLDFDHEMAMAQMNRYLEQSLQTIFIPTHPQYFHLSSTLIKEVASHGGDISSLVPPLVLKKIAEKIS